MKTFKQFILENEVHPMIDVDGEQKHRMNSEGKPIHKTDEGIRNFHRWFGDSKVTDKQGRPQVVYHGSDKEISTVNPKKGAQGTFWFASHKSAIESGDVGASASGKITPMYAKISKPAGWKEYDRLGLDDVKRRHGGAILPDSDTEHTGFIFKPNQIKHAEKNSGAFSTESNNIKS